MPELKPYHDPYVDEIHRIRDEIYEETKNMTMEELNDYYNIGAEYCRKQIQKIKEEKAKKQAH
jgi:hypothetical protein